MLLSVWKICPCETEYQEVVAYVFMLEGSPECGPSAAQPSLLVCFSIVCVLCVFCRLRAAGASMDALEVFSTPSGYGVRARRRVSVGEVVAVVPRSVTIDGDTARAHSTFGPIVADMYAALGMSQRRGRTCRGPSVRHRLRSYPVLVGPV